MVGYFPPETGHLPGNFSLPPISLLSAIINHECEGGLEKSDPEDHCLASQGILSDDIDFERPIFLSHPHTNNGFFFLLTIKFCIFHQKRIPKVPDYSEMRHKMMMLL